MQDRDLGPHFDQDPSRNNPFSLTTLRIAGLFRDFNLYPVPPGDPNPLNLDNRLVLSRRGSLHFDQALSTLGSYFRPHFADEAVKIAQTISSAGVPPTQVLEFLRQQRNTSGSDFNRRIINRYIAQVHALLGDYEEALQIAQEPDENPRIDTYAFAASVQIERGEDPTVVLETAERTIKGYDKTHPKGGASVCKALDYPTVGSLYAQAGMTDKARQIFSLAEEMIDRARDQYNQAYQRTLADGKNEADAARAGLDASDLIGHGTYYNTLVYAYNRVGWYEDALRVSEKLREDKSHYFSFAVQAISSDQMAHGLVDQAVQTAQKVGGFTYLNALAQKALHNAQKGKQDQNLVAQIDAQAEKQREAADDYIQIQTTLGQAELLVGNQDIGSLYFTKAFRCIEEEPEAMFRAPMLLDFTRAVGDAGFDNSGLYGRVLQAAREINPGSMDTYPDDQLKWGVWYEVIKDLCNKGDFDLAQQALEAFTPANPYVPARAKLLAHLGASEIRRSGIVTEEARQGAAYFGL